MDRNMERHGHFIKKETFKPGDLIFAKGFTYSWKLFDCPAAKNGEAAREQVGKIHSNELALVLKTSGEDIYILTSRGCGWIWEGNIEHIY